jgi:integrase/recombinase XerD
MEHTIKDYHEALMKDGLSKNTMEAYIRDISIFLEFLSSSNLDITRIDKMTMMAYIQSLQKSGHAASSIARNIISVRKFYKFLIKRGTVSQDPTYNYEMPKMKRNLPEILTVEEVDILLSVPDITTFSGKRDKAMLEVMYATGVKVTELLDLTMYDINLKLQYIKCKGIRNKERIIPFGKYAAKYLEDYILSRTNKKDYNTNIVFLNSRGNRMTRQGFWKILKQYADIAKINKPLNTYTIRHSFAVHLLQNGADIRSIQELLGNSGMASIQMYTNISERNKLSEVYKKSHPRA